jgi:putative membrane protein
MNPLHFPISCRIALTSIFAITTSVHAADIAAPDKFLVQAIQDGRAEIQICRLALSKSNSLAVKEFAQRMIKDHTAINKKIESIAQHKNIALPDGTTMKQKSTYDMLELESGTTFDRSFAEHNVNDHANDIEEFTAEAKGGSDSEVKAMAAEVLKTLNSHMRQATNLNAKLSAKR